MDRERIPIQKFGLTGHMSTRVIFGGAALGGVSQEDADGTLELLLQFGVNHIDVAAEYGDGEAEKRIGPWMNRHRRDFFLATKVIKRNAQEARAEFSGSLERLRVDSVDLLQLHCLSTKEDLESALSAGGAIDAVMEAREQGLTRFIGVTSHGTSAPDLIFQSLDRCRFDSVLLPYNYLFIQNKEYARSFGNLVARCKTEGVAVQTIKSMARRPWLGRHRNHDTWYEPLVEQEDVRRAVHWVLADPAIFLITPGDISLLPALLSAAAQPVQRPDDSEMSHMLRSLEMQPIFQGSREVY